MPSSFFYKMFIKFHLLKIHSCIQGSKKIYRNAHLVVYLRKVLNNEKKCKKKEKRKRNERCDINLFRSYFLTFDVVFFIVKCQNSASDLIQCSCAKCVFLSAYECLQKYICIHIITYLS